MPRPGLAQRPHARGFVERKSRFNLTDRHGSPTTRPIEQERCANDAVVEAASTNRVLSLGLARKRTGAGGTCVRWPDALSVPR